MYVAVRVIGVHEVEERLRPSFWTPRVKAGVKRMAELLDAEEKTYVGEHRVTGQMERAFRTSSPRGSGFNVSATITVNDPGARPIMYGWFSAQGKRPPTSAIAAWMIRKGIAPSRNVRTSRVTGRIYRTASIASIADEWAVKSAAYAISRSIGRRGYTFNTGRGGQHIKTFVDAWGVVKGQAIMALAEELARP